MMKSMLMAVAILVQQASAASKCSVTVSTYSDDTCSTAKEVLPLYVGGTASLEMEFHKCWSKDGSNEAGSHLQVAFCDPELIVGFVKYNDASCMSKSSPAMEAYYPDTCMPVDGSTWVKVTDVELTGNKYGIGYQEAWSIFLCQTVLFGVCAGYS